jgi:hypothetical protein
LCALLLTQITRLGIPALLDADFAPHGNRQGLSLGWRCALWLAHVLSRADHRPCIRPNHLHK